ncbi:hypothetical protein [Afipia broomeae]|uniref:Uncharacterized protein n=1 Tax=Afipia broomeae ATCC 49717 TaxID=883078 RepID=K8P0T2_9BRAD|nr:hypothetical protein [Afipia broomeae]EKS34339.1 hypothetical protein HMPREF9695_04249 [Afipia broomeae ATCC 49717]
MLKTEQRDFTVKAYQSSASIISSPAPRMAAVLRTMGVDLKNERDVIRVLIGAKFTDRQVKRSIDHAIALAR